MTMDIEDLIQTRPAYVVRIHDTDTPSVTQFPDVTDAVDHLTRALGAVAIDQSDFEGRVSWYTTAVPATPFDALLTTYSELYDEGGLDGVDREDPYLIVEEHVRGGYWLTTGTDPEVLAENHLLQEYSGEWNCEGIFDTRTGDREQVTIEVTL